MAQIVLDSICKTFRIAERPPGFFGILKGAFVRTYKDVHALSNITFSIDEGELVGYIGPNGAGKSTTVKVMSGILVPDKGTCKIMSKVPWKERVSHVSRIGVVFGQRSQLWWDVPVIDSFDLLKDIYNLKHKEYSSRLSDLTSILNIGGLLNTPVRQLSLGQRMRCEVAASLLHNPKILFLDEPTIGLDAVSKLALREFLLHMNKKYGVTMILTTHDMDDIEALCSRVMVIGNGQLLYDGNLPDLKHKYSPLRQIRAAFSSKVPELSVPDAESVTQDNDQWIIHFDPEKLPAHTMIANLAKRYPLKDIIVKEQDIDQMISTMYRELSI